MQINVELDNNGKGNHSYDYYDEESDLPYTKAITTGYEDLTRILPKKFYTVRGIGLTAACSILALSASYYNFQFGREYVYEVSRRLNFDEASANAFGEFCGSMGFIINTSINTISIKQAYFVIKDEILRKKFKNPMPDDNFIRLTTLMMTGLSVIGAFPNLKFVYDTTKNSHPFYLAYMLGVQFVTVFALNLRGLYNTFKIDSEKKQVVKRYKYALLNRFNNCLEDKDKLSNADLISLSQGILVRKRLIYVQRFLKIFCNFYVCAYSAAFYFPVKNALSNTHTGTFLDDLVNFGVTSCGILAALLKLFLLGSNAYSSFIDKKFNLFQEPILKINQNEIRSQYISRNADRALALIGLVCAIFSLGSSSKIVEKYFFEQKTPETFWLSLLIGGGAALAINANDISTVMEKIIDFFTYIYKSKLRPYYRKLRNSDELNKNNADEFSEQFGNSHEEMMLKCMLEIAMQPEMAFLKKYTEESLSPEIVNPEVLNNQVQSIVYPEGEEKEKEKEKDITYYHRYSPSGFFNYIKSGCEKLEVVINNANFVSWRQKVLGEKTKIINEQEGTDKPMLRSMPSARSYGGM